MNISFFYSKNFIYRTLSAIVLMPLALFIIYIGGYGFKGFVIASSVLMAFEWARMIGDKTKEKKWKLIGLTYITLPALSIIYLREQPDGIALILFLLSCIWATDIGAYICGTAIGGPKIAPKISPKKSWAGMIGGFICALLIGIVFSNCKILHFQSIVSISILTSLLGQIGDLLESALKRNFNVKDSGVLIPGHGGVLDRVDSLVISAPVFALIVMFGAGI